MMGVQTKGYDRVLKTKKSSTGKQLSASLVKSRPFEFFLPLDTYIIGMNIMSHLNASEVHTHNCYQWCYVHVLDKHITHWMLDTELSSYIVKTVEHCYISQVKGPS